MVAIAKTAAIRGITDAKIYALTSDTSGTITYGAGIDIPFIQSAPITYNVATDQLPGDGVIGDIYSQIQSVSSELKLGHVSLDVLNLITAGTITASGTTPNQKQTLTVTSGSCPYFKIEGASKYANTGTQDVKDAHFTIQKAKVSGDIKINWTNDGYCDLSFPIIGIIPTCTTITMMPVVFNETAATIAA